MNESYQAITALKAGELAILPTETVYGLFADALNEAAVNKLYAVKGRPTDKALNLNVADYATILKFSKNQPDVLEALVSAFLPGPLTLVLEASAAVPEWVHSGKTTVGFRMPAVPVTFDIIRTIGVLVGPSANLTGAPSPRFFSDLTSEILDNAAIAIQDDSIHGLDTTILDLTSQPPRLLRQGAITLAEIQAKIPGLGKVGKSAKK